MLSFELYKTPIVIKNSIITSCGFTNYMVLFSYLIFLDGSEQQLLVPNTPFPLEQTFSTAHAPPSFIACTLSVSKIPQLVHLYSSCCSTQASSQSQSEVLLIKFHFLSFQPSQFFNISLPWVISYILQVFLGTSAVEKMLQMFIIQTWAKLFFVPSQ